MNLVHQPVGFRFGQSPLVMCFFDCLLYPLKKTSIPFLISPGLRPQIAHVPLFFINQFLEINYNSIGFRIWYSYPSPPHYHHLSIRGSSIFWYWTLKVTNQIPANPQLPANQITCYNHGETKKLRYILLIGWTNKIITNTEKLYESIFIAVV